MLGGAWPADLREPLFLSLGTGEAAAGILHPVTDVEILESIQQKATGMPGAWSDQGPARTG